MLGDKFALSPAQMLHQRLLAGDPIEAAEQAREFLKTGSLEAYYHSILTDGLALAAADSRLGHQEKQIGARDGIFARVGRRRSRRRQSGRPDGRS